MRPQTIGKCDSCGRRATKLTELERVCGKKGCEGRVEYVEVKG